MDRYQIVFPKQLDEIEQRSLNETHDWPVRVYFPSAEALIRVLSGGRTADAPAGPVYMKVAEYAKYRGLSKRTIETRIREGMPLEGRGRYRRVNVERADEWFRSRGVDGVDAHARRDAATRVARVRTENGGAP